MPKAPEHISHFDRFAELGRDITNPRVVAATDKYLLDIMRYWLEVLEFREFVAKKHKDETPPPLPPNPNGDGPRPGAPAVHDRERVSDMIIRQLVDAYKAHEDSPYRKVRFYTRQAYESLLKRILKDVGDTPLASIKASQLLDWHRMWEGSGQSLARSLMTMLRMLFGFGATVLEDPECERLAVVISKFEFKVQRKEKEYLTAELVERICEKAHEMGRPSIALAQALQFDLRLRQRDVIGAWVPLNEPGPDDIVNGDFKWYGGVRWEEIDGNLVLHHVPSAQRSDERPIAYNLRDAPMVRREIERLPVKPESGPMVVAEYTKLPWLASEYRRWWRKIATAAGVPKGVTSGDSRFGKDDEAEDSAETLPASTEKDMAETSVH